MTKPLFNGDCLYYIYYYFLYGRSVCYQSQNSFYWLICTSLCARQYLLCIRNLPLSTFS